MIEIAKDNLCVNQLIANKKEIIMVEGDMIVPDSKPDILNTICTSGVVCVYKKEVQEEKVRIDGNVNTYVMYLPDGTEEGVRGLNTSLDFSESIAVPNCHPGQQLMLTTKVKSIECKVINGRKIGIKATLELGIQIFEQEEVEIVGDVPADQGIQVCKEDMKVNSLVGTGETKIYAKDTVPIEAIDQLAEILKANVTLLNQDIKVSYNKVLTKSELAIKMMYLTEDNRIKTVDYTIPAVGFVDIPNVTEENVCEVNYEIKNAIIKPNAQEEHSIYVEIELEVTCYVYEEKQINLIQDLYSPTQKLSMTKKQVVTMSGKQTRTETKLVQEKVNLSDMEGKNLLDVDVTPIMLKEDKIHSKILYEGELQIQFLMIDGRNQITKQEAKIPFDYVIEDLQNGETLNTNQQIEVSSQDFIVQNAGDVDCRVGMAVRTDMSRMANMNLIDQIEDEGEREEQDYSVMIYLVKEGDTLWKIAKRFGSTVDDIARTNGIENVNQISPGQKLYIPRFVKMPVSHYG